jgi:membrane protease YdiL (CAAX protease family)
MGPRFVRLAVAFYSALLLVAALLGVLWGRNVFVLGDGPLLSLSIGVATACGTVASGIILFRLVPALRKLSEELAPLLVDGARGRDLVLVSVASGMGEEVLFRGALQPVLGIVLTSLLFGVLHVGPDRRYLIWTLWAVGAGFLFGFLYLWTDGLLAPITAHVLHNAATLLLWKRYRRSVAATNEFVRRGTGGALNVLPNTTSRGAGRRWPLYALVAVALVALALGIEALLREESFAPRKEIISTSVHDIIVSPENSIYPPPDTNRFQGPPETVFVYLSVDSLPSGEDMEARVRRAESGSVFRMFFGEEAGLEVLDEQEDQLSKAENGATGIVKFALKTNSGEPVPPGNYTIEVYGSGEADGGGEPMVRKSFVVEEA